MYMHAVTSTLFKLPFPLHQTFTVPEKVLYIFISTMFGQDDNQLLYKKSRYAVQPGQAQTYDKAKNDQQVHHKSCHRPVQRDA